MQQYTDTLYITQMQMNLTISLLQDIHTFDGQDTTKFEDWLSDIETAAGILKESHACLAKPKSHGLIHTLVCEALLAGKSWHNIRDILHQKFCNVSIHTYTSHFMKIQEKEHETLAPNVHHFKIEAKTLQKWHCHHTYFHQGSLGCTQYQRKDLWKGPPDLTGGYQTDGEAQHCPAGYNYPVITYSEHDVKWQ